MRIPLPRSAALPADVRLIRRRSIIKAGVIGGAGALAATRPGLLAPDSASAQTTLPPTPFKVTPFQGDAPVVAGVAPVHARDPVPGTSITASRPSSRPAHPHHAADWDDSALKTYKLVAEQRIAQIIPGVDTPVFTYRDANDAGGPGYRSRTDDSRSI